MTEHEVLRALTEHRADPISDAAIEIVEALEREIQERGTAWHDCELSSIVEEIIKEHGLYPKCESKTTT